MLSFALFRVLSVVLIDLLYSSRAKKLIDFDTWGTLYESDAR